MREHYRSFIFAAGAGIAARAGSSRRRASANGREAPTYGAVTDPADIVSQYADRSAGRLPEGGTAAPWSPARQAPVSDLLAATDGLLSAVIAETGGDRLFIRVEIAP